MNNEGRDCDECYATGWAVVIDPNFWLLVVALFSLLALIF